MSKTRFVCIIDKFLLLTEYIYIYMRNKSTRPHLSVIFLNIRLIVMFLNIFHQKFNLDMMSYNCKYDRVVSFLQNGHYSQMVGFFFFVRVKSYL